MQPEKKEKQEKSKTCNENVFLFTKKGFKKSSVKTNNNLKKKKNM